MSFGPATTSRAAIFVLALVSSAFLLLSPAQAQQRVVKAAKTGKAGKSLVRSQKGLARDLHKLKKVKPTTDLAALLASKSKFTGKLASGAPWRTMTEGKKQFDVSLGRGLTLKVGAGRYDLPLAIGGTQFKLHSLVLSRDGKEKNLIKDDVSISLKESTSYNFTKNRISWRGPESRFSILALLHEQGHVQDFGRASKEQHAEFSEVYNRIANNQTLSNVQHRRLIGLERNAWAYALKTARQLKREGFDVLGKVSSKELSSVINSSLKGYYDYKGTQP